MNGIQILGHLLAERALRRILDQARGFRRDVVHVWIVCLGGLDH